MKRTDLEKQLSDLINCESRENDSNTPDFILSEFMVSCLDAFELASNKREVWFGVELDILNDWKGLIMTAIGEASMCWSDIDKAGVFDSTKAQQIGLKLLQDIIAERLWERMGKE
uniref:Uncharacterized protein n=1 Tax=viral metagenome TaxID=1070528 RepID=A0A6H1ZNC8_9ZZZZ